MKYTSIWAGVACACLLSTQAAAQDPAQANKPVESIVPIEPTAIIYGRTVEPMMIQPVAASTWFGFADLESDANVPRPMDAEQITANAKIDFLLFRTFGLSIWGNYIVNESDGRSPGFLSIDTDGELYAVGGILSYPVLPWLLVGIEGAYAEGDKDSDLVDNTSTASSIDEDISQHIIGGFLQATYQIDAHTLSVTPRFRRIEGNVRANAPVGDDGDYVTTEALVTFGASVLPHHRIRLDAFVTPRILLNDRHPAGAAGPDNFHVNVGGEATFYMTPTVGLFAGYSHDAFDSRWDSHYITAGIRTLIWGRIK